MNAQLEFWVRKVLDCAFAIEAQVRLSHGCESDFTVARMVALVMAAEGAGRMDPVLLADVARIMGCK